MHKVAMMLGQQDLCSRNLSESIVNLPVLCYNGNNDLAALALFVKQLWAQGE